MQNKKSIHKLALRLVSFSITILLMFGSGVSVMAEAISSQSASVSSSATTEQKSGSEETTSSSSGAKEVSSLQEELSSSLEELSTPPEEVSPSPESGQPVSLSPPVKVSIIAFDALAEEVKTQSVALSGITSQDDLTLPTSLLATTGEDAPVTIEGVTWSCAGFDPATADSYTFAATLPEGFVLAEGLAAPAITVILQEVASAEAIMPMSINDVTVTAVPSVTEYQTFTDLDNSTTPQALTVNLNVTVQPKVFGATVELPLAYRPTSTSHQRFSMTEDIFTLVEPIAFPEGSIFTGYSVVSGISGAPDTLVLNIADNLVSAGAESVALRFDFNDSYNGKIDTGNTLWEVEATASVGGTNVCTDETINIKTSATTEITYAPNRCVPLNEKYTGGTLNMRAITRNYHWYQAEFDADYTNIVYIEVPTGTVVDNAVTAYYKEPPLTNGPLSETTSPDVPVGYTRYFRKVKNVSSDWDYWRYNGHPSLSFLQRDISIKPPASLVAGNEFVVRLGADYKKLNGEVRQTTNETKYLVVAEKAWDLYYKAYHSTGNEYPPTVNTAQGSTGNYVNASYSQFMNIATTKNLGTQDITGVSLQLNQASTTSGKVNFSQIIALTDRLDDAYSMAYFRWEYTIKKANGTTVSEEKTTAQQGTYLLSLPTLATGQYIDNIKLIPMGKDGTKEGVLPPKNSIGIRYVPKAWDGEVWPDGKPVAYHTPVPMKYTFCYEDESGQPVTKNGPSININYTRATSAYANVVSSNANGKMPGETVNYEIQGYNRERHGIGALENPRVVVAVPKELELQNPSGLKDFIDKKTGDTTLGCVTTTLVGTNAGHNYYAFQAKGVSGAMVRANPSFHIPLIFKVASGTKEGSYPIPAVATTSENSAGFQNVSNYLMNNLSAHETNMGLGNGKNYAGQSAANHTPLTVISALKLTTETAIRSEGTNGAWAKAAVVPAMHDENVKMKITLKNAGNTTFNDVRIYDILPRAGDGRESSGNISFAGIAATDATVYYTTDATLPAYSTVDLSQGKPGSVSWAQGTPPSNATAVYIDFGGAEVSGGQDLGLEIHFAVPASGNQTAYNNFQYYAKEVSQAGTKIESISSIAGFSTNAIALLYDENLPTPLPNGVTAASNMPAENSGIIGFVPNNKFTVSSTRPTLAGYTFVKWQDAVETAKNYTGGEDIAFTTAGSVTLNAIWESASPTIIFDKNGGDTDASPNSKSFGYGHTMTAGDFPATKPTRAGYEFIGWGTTPVGGVANFNAGEQLNFSGNKTVYAVWTVKTYTLTYDGNGATSGTMSNQTVTFDAPIALIPTTYVKAGHTFIGWSTVKTDTSALYTDGGTYTHTTPTDVTLYAIWSSKAYNVYFNGNGADSGSMSALNVNYGMSETLPANTFIRTGYTFNGWATSASATIADYADKASYTHNVIDDQILYAVWEMGNYTLSFDAQGGAPVPNAQSIKYLGKAQKPADSSRTGYGFVGWFDAPTGGTKWDFATTTMPAKNVTLYAQYVVIKYNVTFNYGGAQINDRVISVDYGSLVSKPNGPRWAGHTFQGWVGENGIAWDFSRDTMPAQNITITAVWKNVSYTVKFLNWDNTELKTQTVEWNKNATPPAKPARSGWTFTKWNGNYTNVTKNETVIAAYTENPATPPTSPSSSSPDGSSGTTRPPSPVSSSSSSSTTTTPGDTGTTPVEPTSGETGTTTNTTGTDTQTGPDANVLAADKDDIAPKSGNSITDMANGTVPLGGLATDDVWSLLNLLVSLGSLFMSIYLIIAAFRRRKVVVINEDGEEEERKGKLKFNAFRLISILAGALTILLFFIFDSISNPMVWVNRWTPILLVTFIVHILFNILGYRKDRSKKEDSAVAT